MGVEASAGWLRSLDRKGIDALFFASTTAPYAEKSISSTIAVVCDLRDDITTSDFSNATKAGSNALRAAIDAAKAKSAKLAIVSRRIPISG